MDRNEIVDLAKETIGQVVGDATLRVDGNADKAKGNAPNTTGDANDAVEDALNRNGHSRRRSRPMDQREFPMRWIVLLAAGVFGAIALTSAAVLARPEIGNFAYPPVSGGEGQPLFSSIPRETISYVGPHSPGTIVINASERRLYFVLPDHQAIEYGVGVGRPGFGWSGVKQIADKREWPDWSPPPQMLRRRPDLPRHMEGGIENPLGAGAMYLSGTLYPIHGSNEPDTIGQTVPSGCIRMTNDDVIDLYERAKVGTPVIVLR